MTGEVVTPWQQINPSGTVTPVPSSGGGSGTLTFETINYTGTGDGTTNPVVFAHKPRVLFFADHTGHVTQTAFVGDDASIGIYPVSADTFTSTLFASTTVDINALNTLLGGSLSDDLNRLNSTYTIFAIETS